MGLFDDMGRKMDSIFGDMEARMDRMFSDSPFLEMQRSSVRVDKTSDGVVISIDVPGLTAKDIDVSYDETTLRMHVEGKGEPRPGHPIEFKRTLRVGRIDVKATKADLKNGLLVIRVFPNLSAMKMSHIPVRGE
jgi:HSP20 family molecular chaperone IbpA